MTLLEWQDQFATENACQEYLFQQRWPDGFVCPQCQGKTFWTIQRSGRTPFYECKGCGHQACLTAGTVFHRTKVSLRVWFMAIFRIAVDKGGKLGMALSRELGLRYETAWLLHHKIQQALKDRNAGYQLGGLVELDDAYFGGVSHGAGKRDRRTDEDPVIVGVSLDSQGHPRHIFLDAVPDLKKDSVLQVLDRRVEYEGVRRTEGPLSMPREPTLMRPIMQSPSATIWRRRPSFTGSTPPLVLPRLSLTGHTTGADAPDGNYTSKNSLTDLIDAMKTGLLLDYYRPACNLRPNPMGP